MLDPVIIPLEALLRGFHLIRQPRFRQYVWRPAACSLIIVAVFSLLALSYVQIAVDSIAQLLPSWLSFLASILATIVHVALIVFSAWLVGFVAVIISSPFLGPLSSQTEVSEFGSMFIADESLIKSAVSAYKRELIKLRYHVGFLVTALITGLVLTPIAPLIWFVTGAWLTALQFVDYAPENRGLPFSHTRSLLRRNPIFTIVFGGVVVSLLAFPFLNVLAIPASVCGGTILWNVLNELPAKSPTRA